MRAMFVGAVSEFRMESQMLTTGQCAHRAVRLQQVAE
jgi:hypothetical protein